MWGISTGNSWTAQRRLVYACCGKKHGLDKKQEPKFHCRNPQNICGSLINAPVCFGRTIKVGTYFILRTRTEDDELPKNVCSLRWIVFVQP